jgi:hypothetical protein
MQGKWVRVVVVTGGAVALFGCAVGSSMDDFGVSDLATAPVEAGTDGTSVKLEPPAPPPTDDGGTGDDGGDPGTGDAGADSGGAPDGGGGTSCASPNVCTASTSMGSISGDTGSDTQNAQGTTSQWLSVRVTENDSSIFANSLEMKATLVSPPGANFDLYLYVPGTDTIECSAVSASSTTTGTDTAGVEFGESGTFSNGVDDSRTVTVEVRHVSGTCSAGAKWTLSVVGNQH